MHSRSNQIERGRSWSNRSRRAAFLFWLALFLGAVSANGFAQSEGAGSALPALDASVRERVDWLAAHGEHTAAGDVLDDILDEVRTIPEILYLSEQALANLSPDLKGRGYRSVAAVLRSARRLEEAARDYGLAYEASGRTDLRSLFLQGQLLFELGDLSAADARARRVIAETSDYEIRRRAYTLAALIAYESGHEEEARRMLQTLASLNDSDYVEVESLVLLKGILDLAGDSTAAEQVEAMLVALFPESVDTARIVADNRYLRPAALPSALLLSPAGESPVVTTEPALPESEPAAQRRDQPQLSAVQVGSFSDPDNAMHLTRDLNRLSLDARTETISREGRSLYQVVVRIPGGKTEDAARVLSILRDNGFDGFLVY